jgi:hypothetical protein
MPPHIASIDSKRLMSPYRGYRAVGKIYCSIHESPLYPGTGSISPRSFYRFSGEIRLRSRTPGPPPFSSMNSTPAFSKARLMTVGRNESVAARDPLN